MVARTKSKIACFAGPSFQDGSKPPPAVAVCATAATGRSGPDNASNNASVESRARRLILEEGAIGFMVAPTLARRELLRVLPAGAPVVRRPLGRVEFVSAASRSGP